MIVQSMLQETTSKLKNLHERGIGSMSSVAKAITGCSSDINDFLLEYSVAFYFVMFVCIRLHHHYLGFRSNANRSRGARNIHGNAGHAVTQDQHPWGCHPGRRNRIRTCLAGGILHLIPGAHKSLNLRIISIDSLQQLTMMLGVVFHSNSIQARVQRQYLETGQYSLSIDQNTEVTQLTSDDWPSIEPGTKIVMSIVVKQQRERTESYQCYLCKTWNSVSSANQGRTYLIDW